MDKILSTRKKIVKKILAKAKKVKQSELQSFIVECLERTGVTQGTFADATDSSRGRYMHYRHMTSIMGLDVLDKILSTWPDLKIVLAHHLMGNKTENISGNITHTEKTPTNVENDEDQLRSELQKVKKQLNDSREISTLLKNLAQQKEFDLTERDKKIAALEAEIIRLNAELKKLRDSSSAPNNSKK